MRDAENVRGLPSVFSEICCLLHVADYFTLKSCINDFYYPTFDVALTLCVCVCLHFHFLSLVLISTIGFDNYYNKYIPSELVDNEFSDSVCVSVWQNWVSGFCQNIGVMSEYIILAPHIQLCMKNI